MIADVTPIVAAFVLFALATAFGIPQIKALIQIREARLEMHRGSAGQLRGLSRWMGLVLWILSVWILALIIGYFIADGAQPHDPDSPLRLIHVPKPKGL